MAWRKRYYKSRRRRGNYRRRFKRTYRRRYRRLYRKSSNVHHFRRSAAVTVVSTSPGFPEFNGAATFRLTDVFGTTEFTSLFEYFRLNCVVLKFYPDWYLGTATTGGTSLTTSMPQLHVVWDYNDGNPQNILSMNEFQTYKTYRFNRMYSFKIYPKVSTEIYQSAALTGYGLGKKQWIHTTSPSIPHYGFKFGIDNYNQSANQVVSFKIRAFYYFSVKGVK